MSEKPSTAAWELPEDDANRIDSACDRFEAAWQVGERPAIESFLGDERGLARAVLFRELLRLEVTYRNQASEHPTCDEYRARYPEFADQLEALFQGSTAPPPVSAPEKGTATDPPPTQPVPLTPLEPVLEERYDLPRIPGYTIIRELGRGAMGIVYHARQQTPKRDVALKVIRDVFLAGPAHRTRFRIEAEAAARFQHPNLIRIFEVNEHQGAGSRGVLRPPCPLRTVRASFPAYSSSLYIGPLARTRQRIVDMDKVLPVANQ